MSGSRLRLDMLLVKRGLCETREKAKACVMSGQVLVMGVRADKAGLMVEPQVQVEVLEQSPYVGRGGHKLEKALHSFNVNLQGKVVLDIGASTGGFTDCALQHGARLVYAVDVGYGQLAWKLRSDPRVVVLERTNIRYLLKETLEIPPDFVVIDVSFISLSKVLPKITELTGSEAEGIALIKPQFEAGREKVGKRGVVRDPRIHREIIYSVFQSIEKCGWGVRGLDFSPLKGPQGNIEYLIYFDRRSGSVADIEKHIFQIVDQANAAL